MPERSPLARLLAAHGDLQGQALRWEEEDRALLQNLLLWQRERGVLQDLILWQRELRADFTVLVSCLEARGLEASGPLHCERFRRARRRSAWAPGTGARLEGVLGDARLAACVLAAAGQEEWAAMRRTSRSARHHADAIREDKLYVAGGIEAISSSGDDWLKTSECLDLRSGSWEAAPELNAKRYDHVGAVLHGYLYVCGGWSNMGRRVMRLNPARCRWENVPPMNAPRAKAAAAVVGQRLYVCGGQDDTQVWSTVERFNPLGGVRAKGVWDVMPDMVKCRRSHAAVALEGELLVCGGSDGPLRFDHFTDVEMSRSAESVRPGPHSWRSAPSMTYGRASGAAVALNGKAYVCGGYLPGTDHVHTTVECFDPSTRSWSQCPSMTMLQPRWGHAALVFAGKLHVIGGCRRLEPGTTAECSVERLEHMKGSWKVLEPMEAGRASLCAGAVALGPAASVA